MNQRKYGIVLDSTKESLELFEFFLKKINFSSNEKIEVLCVQEFESQEKEIIWFKNQILLILKNNNLRGDFILEKGDFVARIKNLVIARNINILFCKYEHSILGNTFFEKIIKEINIPIMLLGEEK